MKQEFLYKLIDEYLFSKGEKQAELFELVKNKSAALNNNVYVRGAIEMSNICTNQCKYCSMSESNKTLRRYKMSTNEICDVVKEFFGKGINNFHLSSGENGAYEIEELCEIVGFIKLIGAKSTLVIGARSNEELLALYTTGANTVIGKFETSCNWLYNEYNDKDINLDNRINFLKRAENIGFKIGTGNIIGLPYQYDEVLKKDLLLTNFLNPDQASTSVFTTSGQSEYSYYIDKNGFLERKIHLNYIALMRLILSVYQLQLTSVKKML